MLDDAQPVRGFGLICVNYDVVALADTNADRARRVRMDGYEVTGNDRHVMVVQGDDEEACTGSATSISPKGKSLLTVDGGVDEADAVLLARGESRLESSALRRVLDVDIGAVDKSVVGRGRE